MRPVLFTLLLLAELPAVADLLPVSAMGIIEQDRFTLSRNYAGQLHARRTSELGFESGGVLSDIAVREGEPVLKGQQLMSLAPDAMVARLRQAEATSATASANLVASRARLELAAITERRYAELVSRGHGSQQQLDELHSQYQVEAANVDVAAAQLQNAGAAAEVIRVDLARLTVQAPFDGTIQIRHVDEGSIVSPGQPILRLIETGSLEARIGIPAERLPGLYPGQQYDFSVAGRRLKGVHTGVLPVADQDTGIVTALFVLDDNQLHAGTLAELTMEVEVLQPGFWIPLTALAESQRGLWSVLAVSSDGDSYRVNARLVEILHRGDDRVYVRGTLADGDLIVRGGTERIVSGQQVRVARVVDAPFYLPTLAAED